MTDAVTYSRPYAEAAYKIASETNDIEKWTENLSILSHIIIDSQVKAIIASPKISTKKTIEFLNSFLVTTDELFTNFLEIMIANKKVYYIDEVYKIFLSMLLDDDNMTVAEIQTAIALTEKQKSGLTDMLQNKYNKKIKIDEIINENLLAGIKISIDNEVVDYSVRYKLNSMKEQIINNR